MQKLKSALRRKKKSGSTDPSDSRHDHGETASPRTPHAEARPRRVSIHSKAASEDTGRPVSSAYSSNHMSDAPTAAGGAVQPPLSPPNGVDSAQPNTPGSIGGSVANDYKTYISAYPDESDAYDEKYMTLGGDRRLITGESEGHHEEDVADRNISRYRKSVDAGARIPLPASPVMSSPVTTAPTGSRKFSNDGNSFASATSTAPSTGKYVVSHDVVTKGGLVDGILPHTNASDHPKSPSQRADWPARSARDEAGMGWSRRKPHASDSEEDGVPQPLAPLKIHQQQSPASKHKPVDLKPAAMDGQQGSEAHRQLRLDGVVDLRNTVDTDADVHWAPPVTHEILKPHRHEVIKHKIYREIHNYEVYHRIQPVIHTEVLPPRHWIPNPDGEGLIQVSAEDLPARTGSNRWWSIVQHEPAPAAHERNCTYERNWRTQPVVIEGETTVSPEGFERKETTILHPPTLADLSGYTGQVQPIHFDHKTGERWWGEITTLDKLKEQTDRPHEAERSLNLNGLEEALPNGPPQVPLRRKPVPINRKAL